MPGKDGFAAVFFYVLYGFIRAAGNKLSDG